MTLGAAIALLAAGCEAPGRDEATQPATGAAHHPSHEAQAHDHGHVVVLDAAALAALDGDAVELQGDVPVRQLGMLFDADGVEEIVVSAYRNGGWSAPQRAEITWREGQHYVARLLLDAPAERLRIESTAGIMHLRADLWETIQADPDAPLARELPVVELAPRTQVQLEPDGDDVFTITATIEEPSWVVSRAAWGARSPGYICGSRHTPQRLTVHHTATGTPDGSSAPARMRQMQAYHMDTKRWCDIGYHFVVGHDGQVYEGRHSHEHTGAHVGGANSNNVGVSYMGTFTSIVPPDTMMNAGGRILGWLATTYGIALNRTNVRGHRDFGGTSCPGDSLYANLDRLIGIAGGSVTPDPEPTYDVGIDVNWIGPGNPLTTGSSAALPDVWPDDTFQVEILLSNNSSAVIRGVELGYWLEAPYLRATNWAIYSDHPAFDRNTWVINSADGEAANPPRDGLGTNGRLLMHAFSVRETKRVVIDLVAVEPSIGSVDHPDVRAWLRNATDVYGVQNDFFAEPGTNRVGRNVRDYSELDILSRDAWMFDSTASDADTEGFVACADTLASFALNTTDGMLATQVATDAACVESPDWTRIDADRFDQLVIETRSYDGAQQAEVWWTRAGEAFDASRSVRFAVAGDGDRQTLVIPVGEHPDWNGQVTRLRWYPAGDAGSGGSSRWYDTGFVFAQSAGDGATTAPGIAYVELAPVELLDSVIPPADDVGLPDAGVPDSGTPDTSRDDASSPDTTPDPGVDALPIEDASAPETGGQDSSRPTPAPAPADPVTVRSPGCTAAPGLGWWPVALLALARRRRHS